MGTTNPIASITDPASNRGIRSKGISRVVADIPTSKPKADTWPVVRSCMEIETPTSGINVYSVSKELCVNNVNNSMHNEPKAINKSAMEIEGLEKDEMCSKIVSWNIRSVNDKSRFKRILNEQATFTLLQEVWQPKESLVHLLPPSKVMKVRPEGQGGGTMVLWDNRNAEISGQPYEINKDSVISKFVLAGNRFFG